MDEAKILVVDDDQEILVLVRTLLEDVGHEVHVAKDGTTAFVTAQRERPDLFVLDLGMPGGDGLSFLQRLRRVRHFQETPVVILTGSDEPETRKQAEELGASAYLTKPVDRDELLGEVSSRLGAAGDE